MQREADAVDRPHDTPRPAEEATADLEVLHEVADLEDDVAHWATVLTRFSTHCFLGGGLRPPSGPPPVWGAERFAGLGPRTAQATTRTNCAGKAGARSSEGGSAPVPNGRPRVAPAKPALEVRRWGEGGWPNELSLWHASRPVEIHSS